MKRFSELTALLFVVLFLLASCTQYVFLPVNDFGNNGSDDTTPAPAYDWITESDGTGTDPYVLKTVDDILGFAVLVTAGNTFNGKTVELVAGEVYDFGNVDDFDGIGYAIRMSSSATAIVEPYKPFSGTFDGKGATIKNLTMVMDDTDANTDTATGFFNTVYRGTVKDIVFENCEVTSVTKHSGTAIGYALNSNVTEIIVRNSSVTASQTAGGVIGCIFYRPIVADGDPASGQTFTTSDNHVYNVTCYATGANAGAIAGQYFGGYTLSGSSNSGTHVFSNNTAELNSGYTISATSASGGLIGYGSFGHGKHQFHNNLIVIESAEQIVARENPTATGVRGYLIGSWPRENMTGSGKWQNNTAKVGESTYTILADAQNGTDPVPAPGAGEAYNDFAYAAE